MTDQPPCESCGVTTSWTPHRASGDCLNPDCPRCWMGMGAMSLKGIAARLRMELEAGGGSSTGSIGITIQTAKRIADLVEGTARPHPVATAPDETT